MEKRKETDESGRLVRDREGMSVSERENRERWTSSVTSFAKFHSVNIWYQILSWHN